MNRGLLLLDNVLGLIVAEGCRGVPMNRGLQRDGCLRSGNDMFQVERGVPMNRGLQQRCTADA